MRISIHEFLRTKYVPYFLILVLIILSRIPFISHYLWHYDSVNFALAIENYDISIDQPHLPGYIHFVWLGKLVNFFVHDANLSYILISILFTIFTAILLYNLSAIIFSETIAWIASFLYIFNPFVWFNSEVALSYSGDAFYNVLIAYLCYRLIKSKSDRFLFLSAMVLGLSGGLRQNTIVFMAPLWLFSAIIAKRKLKMNLLAILLAGICALTWFAPIIYEFGSYSQYRKTLDSYVGGWVSTTSIFFGAKLSEHIKMFWKLFRWCLVGCGFSIFYLLIYLMKQRQRVIQQIKLNIKFYYFLLWISPSFLFYLLIHITQPGYMLTFLPAIHILTAYLIFKISQPKTQLLNFLQINKQTIFLFSLPLIFYVLYFTQYDSESQYLQKSHSIPMAEKFLGKINTIINYHTIKKCDHITRYYLKTIPQLTNSPDELAIVAFDGSAWTWRKAMYYLPDYTMYRVAITNDHHFARFALKTNHHQLFAAGEISPKNQIVIEFDPGIQRILWLLPPDFKYTEELKQAVNFQESKRLDETIFFSDRNNSVNEYDYGNMIFRFQ